MLQGWVILAAEGVVPPPVALVEAGAPGGVTGVAGVVETTIKLDVVFGQLPFMVPAPGERDY